MVASLVPQILDSQCIDWSVRFYSHIAEIDPSSRDKTTKEDWLLLLLTAGEIEFP